MPSRKSNRPEGAGAGEGESIGLAVVVGESARGKCAGGEGNVSSTELIYSGFGER
jgi:hypothetical protein